MKTGCLKTLIIDDDNEHTEIIREAATGAPATLEISALSNGRDALEYLRIKDRPRPDIIFLDLQLPGLDGFELLAEIRKDPRLRTIPVMVLSSLADVPTVCRAYSAGANLFFAKPLEMGRYRELVTLVTRLWSSFAELPPPPPPAS